MGSRIESSFFIFECLIVSNSTGPSHGRHCLSPNCGFKPHSLHLQRRPSFLRVYRSGLLVRSCRRLHRRHGITLLSHDSLGSSCGGTQSTRGCRNDTYNGHLAAACDTSLFARRGAAGLRNDRLDERRIGPGPKHPVGRAGNASGLKRATFQKCRYTL